MQRYGKPGGKPAPRKRPFERQLENPRMTALNVLQDVSRSDAYASLALSQRLRDSKLPRRDRDLVTELCYGTLERRITLDYFLDLKMERPEIESVVRDILRMGAYQILYLDRIPESAAVDESVKLTRMLDRGPFTGLVNGVLRGIAREKENLPWPKKEEDPARYLSVRESLPLWIVKRLIDAYGPEEAEQIAAYRPQERRITLRRTPDQLPPEAFEALMAEKGWQFEKGLLQDVYYVTGIGDVGLDKAYLKGLYSVQGESSMLAAQALAPRRGQSLLDACAAPGGKTACLAQAMAGTGRVHAWDVHEHRAELIRSMAKRLRLDSVRPAVRDATLPREDLFQTMDGVLIDAPCSGLGVMLSKPDVKYRQTPEAVLSLAEVQKKLLDACCQYVKAGGALVYSTCTLLPEENEEQVRAFLERHPEFELDGPGLSRAMPEALKARAAEGMLQLQAFRDGMDGFFIARMTRKRR